jgi:hypothetical protein
MAPQISKIKNLVLRAQYPSISVTGEILPVSVKPGMGEYPGPVEGLFFFKLRVKTKSYKYILFVEGPTGGLRGSRK